MTTDLLPTSWTDLDSAELRFILLECIGKPGQYDGRDSNPNTFYLPLAGSSCRVKLTFSESKQIVAIEPGPAFDAAQWEKVVEDQYDQLFHEAMNVVGVGVGSNFAGKILGKVGARATTGYLNRVLLIRLGRYAAKLLRPVAHA